MRYALLSYCQQNGVVAPSEVKKIQIHLMNNNRTSLKFLVSGLVKMRDIPIFPK